MKKKIELEKEQAERIAELLLNVENTQIALKCRDGEENLALVAYLQQQYGNKKTDDVDEGGK